MITIYSLLNPTLVYQFIDIPIEWFLPSCLHAPGKQAHSTLAGCLPCQHAKVTVVQWIPQWWAVGKSQVQSPVDGLATSVQSLFIQWWIVANSTNRCGRLTEGEQEFDAGKESFNPPNNFGRAFNVLIHSLCFCSIHTMDWYFNKCSIDWSHECNAHCLHSAHAPCLISS